MVTGPADQHHRHMSRNHCGSFNTWQPVKAGGEKYARGMPGKIEPTKPGLHLPAGFSTDYRVHPRATGTVRGLMVFVDFPDAPAPRPSWSVADYRRLLVDPAAGYFRRASFGRLDLDITLLGRWLRLPLATTEYSARRHPAHRDYLAAALEAAAKETDLAGYDIFYVVPYTSQQVFPNSPTFIVEPERGVQVGGKLVNAAVTFGRDIFRPGRGHTVLVHETLHVFGIPDLYEFGVDDFNRFVGAWDVQGWVEVGGDLLVWNKWKLGWVDDDNILCVDRPGRLTARLAPARLASSSPKAVVVAVNDHTAYLLEHRDRRGLDRGQARGGILVYRVDADLPTGHGPIQVEPAQRPADGETSPASPQMYWPLAYAPYSLGPGRVSSYRNPDAGLAVNLLDRADGAYHVEIAFDPS